MMSERVSEEGTDSTTAGTAGAGAASNDEKIRERVRQVEGKIRENVAEFEKCVRDGMRNLFPEDVTSHLSNSKKEFLLAMRRMIDREIEKTDNPKTDNPKSDQ